MNYNPIIPKEHLIHGAYYQGSCRNATVARWNAKEECFFHWREKFGAIFIEKIKCPEDDNTFDVFVADHQIINYKEIPFNAKY